MLHKVQRLARAIWQRLPVGLKIGAARAIQPKFTVSATAIIINPSGEVLLLEHVLRPGSGWALPGGFLKAKEQPETALRREMLEEIGLEIDNVRACLARTSRTHVEIFFLAEPIGEPLVKSREIMDYKWFSLDQVPRDMSHTQQLLLRDVLQNEFDKRPTQGLKSKI